MTEIWQLSVTEGLVSLRDGSLSAAAWAEGLLSRIDRFDAELKAWTAIDREAVLARAGEIDAGQSHGSLCGTPLGIKDIIDVAGLPCECGSSLFAGNRPARDAPVVSRLRAAGAVVLGKATTCELATNQPSAVRNPWNPAYSPGASSSGSAAAVAAGMVPAALGTQTGGSVIRPAAFCGVVGFKPTFDRVPKQGVLPLAWSVDHVGFITRAVQDLGLLLTATARPAPDLAGPRRPQKVCFLKDDFLPLATPEIAEWISGAVARLSAAGIAAEEARLPLDFETLHSAHRIVVRAEAAAQYEDLFRPDPMRFGPEIRNNITTGLMLPAVHYLRAQRLRRRLARGFDRLCERYDLLVCPATTETAPRFEVSSGNPLFNEPFSASGHPSLTLPLGRGDNNLPVGIQLAGPRMGDETLLAHAAWCEAELGWAAEIASLDMGGTQ